MFSLIITTYNEADNIRALLHDVRMQSHRPAELLIVDAGSTDGTPHICKEFASELASRDIQLRLTVSPGVNIARGRNIAIDLAAHENICVTDAGCRLDTRWCERIISPLLCGEADFVGGFFRPIAHNRFQHVLAVLTISRRPSRNFLPSSRSVAFSRSAWRTAGGYPEWLRWGEDTLFNEMCIATGARYKVEEEALVYWEVRPDLRAALTQYYRYALGDGMRRRASLSHALNGALLLGSIVLAIVLSPVWLLLFVGYCIFLVARKITRIPPQDVPLALATVAAIRVVRVAGYVRGLVAGLYSQSRSAYRR